MTRKLCVTETDPIAVNWRISIPHSARSKYHATQIFVSVYPSVCICISFTARAVYRVYQQECWANNVLAVHLLLYGVYCERRYGWTRFSVMLDQRHTLADLTQEISELLCKEFSWYPSPRANENNLWLTRIQLPREMLKFPKLSGQFTRSKLPLFCPIKCTRNIRSPSDYSVIISEWLTHCSWQFFSFEFVSRSIFCLFMFPHDLRQEFNDLWLPETTNRLVSLSTNETIWKIIIFS